MTFLRSAVVDTLAAAWRHQGTPYADLVLANRERDAFPAERVAALSRVLLEAQAELVIAGELRFLAFFGELDTPEDI